MQGVLERMGRARRPPLYRMTPQDARAAYAAGAGVLELPPAALDRVENLQLRARDGCPLPLRLYAPTGLRLPVLLLGSGCYRIGSSVEFDYCCVAAASAARELLNKSDNERSGVLSTAMSFLGLYRDPVVAEVTRRCDWRIVDIVGGKHPTTLYLVVPPSDINRTKPLIRLILNQVGRRLTEDLQANGNRHRLLLMLDEFPALGRLDFFESALAFMAGYGLKAFLIAQSLNQIEKAYGPNNSILDNCHVRVSFATNDERTAKRVSDALGTATEMRAMKNYAGHRLSPWLGHMMVSRSETARQLMTPGEIMQLPPADEIVMVAGTPPIRAKKARYYEDRRFQERIVTPPNLVKRTTARPDDWSALPLPAAPTVSIATDGERGSEDEDTTDSERRHQPELSRAKPVEPMQPIENEFEIDPRDDADEDAARLSRMNQTMRQVARQASLDPGDGIEL